MNTETKTQQKQPELLVQDSHGIYIPQLFCKNYKSYITNFNEVKEDFNICLKGPDHEDYWDAWDNLTNNIKFTNDKKEMYSIGYLPECCDLWAIPEGYDFDQEES